MPLICKRRLCHEWSPGTRVGTAGWARKSRGYCTASSCHQDMDVTTQYWKRYIETHQSSSPIHISGFPLLQFHVHDKTRYNGTTHHPVKNDKCLHPRIIAAKPTKRFEPCTSDNPDVAKSQYLERRCPPTGARFVHFKLLGSHDTPGLASNNCRRIMPIGD